ncbi:predicted protein [Aspergillus nidulans FGSC A4]|nr:predicted protein [Aspergillus nidulans FGSC A4]|eukprot:XP_658647.1 predicted protein [Aspergillus nidulans FGSC A4]
MSVPGTTIQAIPLSKDIRVRLQVQAAHDTHYNLSAALPGREDFDFIYPVETVLVSGGTGRFTGVLLGVYATSSGRSGSRHRISVDGDMKATARE